MWHQQKVQKNNKLVFQKNRLKKCLLVETRIEQNNDHTRIMREIQFPSSFTKRSIFNLKKEHEQLKPDVESLEQYTRRNCLLVHGIPEEQGQSTGSILLNAINEHLEEELTDVDIERTHRVGKPK